MMTGTVVITLAINPERAARRTRREDVYTLGRWAWRISGKLRSSGHLTKTTITRVHELGSSADDAYSYRIVIEIEPYKRGVYELAAMDKVWKPDYQQYPQVIHKQL